MNFFAFVLNLPWTIIGFLTTVLSVPIKVELYTNPLAFIFSVKSFWWYKWLLGKRGTRAISNGHVIQLSTEALKGDKEHELIHVMQYEREPFIHPFLYFLESFKNGYRNNKYEVEAYSKTDSNYMES